MLKIGLDIGTGFVKCVSNHGLARFPSLYVRRTYSDWSGGAVSEAVGERAAKMIGVAGTAAVRPIMRGRPDPRYQKQVELLIAESVRRMRMAAGRSAYGDEKIHMAVGLPYDASDCRDAISKMIKKTVRAERCDVVAQAVGTLVDLDMSTGMVVSIGQGTSEIVVIEDNRVLDGESSQWASEFITRKIGKFAHLDWNLLQGRKETCRRHAKILAENLATEAGDMAAACGGTYDLALSGGGLLIPGVRDEMESRLKDFTIRVPDDPVMSNASGLYKLVE